VAESKTYRFKVTAADGSTASSAIFSWPPPPGEQQPDPRVSESSSAQVSALPAEEEDHVEVTGAAEP
jgi:hypothetical protein